MFFTLNACIIYLLYLLCMPSPPQRYSWIAIRWTRCQQLSHCLHLQILNRESGIFNIQLSFSANYWYFPGVTSIHFFVSLDISTEGHIANAKWCDLFSCCIINLETNTVPSCPLLQLCIFVYSRATLLHNLLPLISEEMR